MDGAAWKCADSSCEPRKHAACVISEPGKIQISLAERKETKNIQHGIQQNLAPSAPRLPLAEKGAVGRQAVCGQEGPALFLRGAVPSVVHPIMVKD